MDPHIRAQNLREFLSRLGLDASTFAEISGLARQQVQRFIGGDTKWRSAPALKKAAQTFGMDQLQFERMLDGETPMPSAVSAAKEWVRKGLAELDQRRAVAKRVRAAAAKFSEDTGEDTYKGLPEFAGLLVWRVAGATPTDAAMARAVAYVQDAMGDILRRAEVELKPSDRPPHARPSGSIRRGRRG